MSAPLSSAASGETDAEVLTARPLKRELRGWYAFAFASEPISAVAISGFFPLLIQEAALAAAGFPAVCPNIASPALAALAFPATRNATAFLYSGVEPAFYPSSSCLLYSGNGSGGGVVLCPGLPTTSEECLTARGLAGQHFPLRTPSTAGVSWDPTAYVTALVSIATLLQLLIFIALGSLADYGTLRTRILQGLSLLCILFSTLALTVGPLAYEAAGTLFVLLTVAYGATFVQYNGFLPALAAEDADTLAAPPERREAVLHSRMNTISSHGYGWGYIAAIVVLLACVGVTVGMPGSAADAYRVNVALAGFWFLAFGLLPFLWMRLRPGPPLPAGANHCQLPWGEALHTLRQFRRLPNTFFLLGCWFFYADGMNLIGNIGAQYANVYVDWRPIPKGLGLACMLLLVPIFAAAGNFFWPWVERRYALQAWQVVVVNCLLCACVPAYGLLGLLHPALGFRRWYDMLLGVTLYGVRGLAPFFFFPFFALRAPPPPSPRTLTRPRNNTCGAAASGLHSVLQQGCVWRHGAKGAGVALLWPVVLCGQGELLGGACCSVGNPAGHGEFSLGLCLSTGGAPAPLRCAGLHQLQQGRRGRAGLCCRVRAGAGGGGGGGKAEGAGEAQSIAHVTPQQ